MKRITAAVLAMIMSVTLAFGAFAETAETGSEVPSEQVNETLEIEEEDENAFLTWLREGANLISCDKRHGMAPGKKHGMAR